MLMTVGIALCLKPTWEGLGAAAFYGLVVGVLKVFARNRGMLETLLPTIAAFVVAIARAHRRQATASTRVRCAR